MTRNGPAKKVEEGFADGRLRIARSYLNAARVEAAMAEEGDIGNPAMSQVVNAAIGFADALTARYAGHANQQDHAAAVKALRGALGNRLPAAQESQLRRILREKDAVQYGTRAKTRAEAEQMLAALEEFAAWAEAELRRPR